MDSIITILSIVSTILGSLNIFQFLSWKTEKRRLLAEVKAKEAEADEANINAKQKSIDLQQDQYDFILTKLTDYQRDYLKLSDQMMDISDQYLKKRDELVCKIEEKSNEIALLKSKVIYYKGLSCFRNPCTNRIFENQTEKS